MRYTEDEISGLKAQEAKDYCIELLQELKSLTSGPISPGEAQLQELQFELKLQEAEAEDQRRRDEHHLALKELELQIEQEKARHAESAKAADSVREQYATVIQRVEESQEKLSIQLERATREHKVRIEMMEETHRESNEQLQAKIAELGQQRDELKAEIGTLSELQIDSQEISDLREQLKETRDESVRELKQLQEQIDNERFEKKKELTKVRREQELELARMKADHEKAIYETNTEASDQLLDKTGFTKIAPQELETLRTAASEQHERTEEEAVRIRRAAVDDFRRTFNITSAEGEPINVTELFYSQKSLQEENVSLTTTVGKLEAEISRMRTHIEKESERVAKAIEAARTNIQNNIEPGVKH